MTNEAILAVQIVMLATVCMLRSGGGGGGGGGRRGGGPTSMDQDEPPGNCTTHFRNTVCNTVF